MLTTMVKNLFIFRQLFVYFFTEEQLEENTTECPDGKCPIAYEYYDQQAYDDYATGEGQDYYMPQDTYSAESETGWPDENVKK